MKISSQLKDKIFSMTVQELRVLATKNDHLEAFTAFPRGVKLPSKLLGLEKEFEVYKKSFYDNKTGKPISNAQTIVQIEEYRNYLLVKMCFPEEL